MRLRTIRCAGRVWTWQHAGVWDSGQIRVLRSETKPTLWCWGIEMDSAFAHNERTRELAMRAAVRAYRAGTR